MADTAPADRAIVDVVVPKLYAAIDGLITALEATGQAGAYRAQIKAGRDYLPAQYAQSWQRKAESARQGAEVEGPV